MEVHKHSRDVHKYTVNSGYWSLWVDEIGGQSVVDY